MNSTLHLHNWSHATAPPKRPHAPGFDELQALKTKALERWENEGGKISEAAGLARAPVAPSPANFHR